MEGINNAVEAGQGLFNRTIRPDQMRVDLQRMSQPELEAMLQGARDSAAHVMDATYRGSTRELDMFQAPQSQQKLRMLLQAVHGQDAGNEATDNLITAMNRERGFSNVRTTAIQNSETARRLAYQQEVVPPPGFFERGTHGYSPHVTPGVVTHLGAIPEREAIGLADRYSRMREHLANLLTSRGQAAGRNLSNALQYTVPSTTVSPMTRRFIDLLGRNVAPTVLRNQQ
jgi:hypothetical protein